MINYIQQHFCTIVLIDCLVTPWLLMAVHHFFSVKEFLIVCVPLAETYMNRTSSA